MFLGRFVIIFLGYLNVLVCVFLKGELGIGRKIVEIFFEGCEGSYRLFERGV